MATEFNAFEMAQQQFDAVADKLQLDNGLRELLRWPQREYHFTIPVTMDDGSTVETKVWHEATILGGHTAMGWFEDITGCYLLNRARKL